MITFPIQAEIFAHFTRIFITFKVLSCIKLQKYHFSRHIIFLISKKNSVFRYFSFKMTIHQITSANNPDISPFISLISSLIFPDVIYY